MNIADIEIFIKESTVTKYNVIDSNQMVQDFLDLDGHNLSKTVLRLKRISETNDVGEKTVLIVEIQNIDQVKFAIKWSAIVKDSLFDPETFDLYLIIVFDDNVLTLEESIRIESSEHVCKKYVQREDESLEELVSRTFITSIRNDSTESTINDPIRKSLQNTSIEHDWLTEQIQNEWKTHLLSSASGIELVDLLIPEIKNNHDIS